MNGTDVTKAAEQSATTTVTTATPGKVEIKDSYGDKPETGNLIITKTFGGDYVSPEEAEGALTFTVQNENGEYLDENGVAGTDEYKITLDKFEEPKTDGDYAGKYVLRFDNIPVGTYTVTEVDTEVPGYTFVSEKSTTDGSAIVAANVAGALVNITDYYEKDIVSNTTTVDISKQNILGKELQGAKLTITGKDADDKDIKITVSQLGDDAEITAETTETQLVFISGTTPTTVELPDGTYTMKEDATVTPQGYSVSTEITFTIENGEVTVDGVKAETKNGTPIIPMVDDANTTLTIIHRSETEEGDELPTDDITFVIKTENEDGDTVYIVPERNPDGTVKTDGDGNTIGKVIEDDDGDDTTIPDDAKIPVKDFPDTDNSGNPQISIKVPEGDYKLIKTDSTIPDYNHEDNKGGDENSTSFDDSTENFDSKTIEVTISPDVPNRTIRDIGIYKLTSDETGTLVITKTIDAANITKEEYEGALTFTVKTGNDKYLDAQGNICDDEQILTLKDFDYDDAADIYTLTFNDVAAGIYIVSETNTEIEGYDLTSVVMNGNDVTDDPSLIVNVTAGEELKTEITDSYDETNPSGPVDSGLRVSFRKVELPAFDEDGSLIGVEGSKYGIFNASESDKDKAIEEWVLGDPFATQVTDADGNITFYVPAPGYYFLQELVAPDGYALSPTPVLIRVIGDNDYEIVNGGEDRGAIAQEITVDNPDGTTSKMVIWREDTLGSGINDQPDTPSKTPGNAEGQIYFPGRVPYIVTDPVAPDLVKPIYGTSETTTEDTELVEPQTEDVGAGEGVAERGSYGDTDRNTVVMVLIMCLALVLTSVFGAQYIIRKNKTE